MLSGPGLLKGAVKAVMILKHLDPRCSSSPHQGITTVDRDNTKIMARRASHEMKPFAGLPSMSKGQASHTVLHVVPGLGDN
jgi:hypothetical protein